MAGNRTRINCLEGNYADHYTTIAVPYHQSDASYSLLTRARVCVRFLSSGSPQLSVFAARKECTAEVAPRPREA